MWIFLGDTAPSKIFVWANEIASVRVGNTKVRPTTRFLDGIEFLLVAWGGAWGIRNGWGWGWGWIIQCNSYEILSPSENCIVIGSGGVRPSGNYLVHNWGDSCFWNIVACWGGWGWSCGKNTTDCWPWANWGSGWGGATWYRLWGEAVSWQGCPWGDGGGYSWGGWGWYSCAGCPATTRNNPWGNGGEWLASCISGACYVYSSWGGGSSYCGNYAHWGTGAWNGGCWQCWRGGNATNYGWGGGASWMRRCDTAWSWYQGVFILRYPSSCWYDITWGTKYLCNGYCIHCFTSSGTLTVN